MGRLAIIALFSLALVQTASINDSCVRGGYENCDYQLEQAKHEICGKVEVSLRGCIDGQSTHVNDVAQCWNRLEISKAEEDFYCKNCDSLNSTSTQRSERLAVQAFDSTSPTTATLINVGDGKFTISGTVFAIILIITGLIFVFLGHKLFKPILFIAGFYVFALLSWVILTGIETRNGVNLFGDNRPIYFMVIALVAGLIGGALFTCLWRLGLWAIGALLGFTLGIYILDFVSHGTISSGTGRVVYLIVLCFAGIIMIAILEKPMLILGTAFPGSYGFFFGIDIFLNTGFNVGLQSFLSSDGLNYVASAAGYGMLAGVLALAIVGSIVQYRTSLNHKSYRERSLGNVKSAPEKV